MRVVGIDLGTRKASLCLTEEGVPILAKTHECHEVSADYDRMEQLRELAHWTYDWCETYQPDWIFIEKIIVGNNRKYSIGLAEVSGAVMADLANLRDRRLFGFGEVDNKQWKKHVIGNGNAHKDDIKNWLTGKYPEYAGLCANQDEIDATCIAIYGHDLVGRADGLHLD